MGKQYHRASIRDTCVSLRAFLEAYQSNPHDEGLDDPVTYMTQDEYFLEAQSNIEAVLKLPLIRTIMHECPMVCRTLTVSRVHVPGIKMNPWLHHVCSMPNVLRYMSTSDFLKFHNKMHGSEFINCAMLVTRNPSGSVLACGAGKHVQSFMLCGTDDVYHPDADLATWAMVVAHILARPDQQSWMLDELESIRFMHGAVYAQPHSSWRKYLDTVRSDDFRLALVTQSRKLEPWLQCPHLHKFMLACFLLKDELGAQELEARRNAAIQEFFGRQSKPKLLGYMFESGFEVQLSSIFESIPFTLKPTLRETVVDFTIKVHKLSWKDVPIKVVDPNQHTVRMVFANLSCASILCFFDKLCDHIPELDNATWLQLFTTGMSVPDSYRRNTELDYKFDRTKLMRDIRARLRNDALERVPKFIMTKFQHRMLEAHSEPPVLVTKQHSELFKIKHGRDLIAELDINDFGLSLTACMCPKCPRFGKPLGHKTNAQEPCKELYNHTQSLAPRINGLTHVHVLFRAMEVNDPAVTDVLRYFYRTGGVLSFDQFEKYFI